MSQFDEHLVKGINVLSTGEGTPVIFISGLGGLAGFWKPVMSALGKGVQSLSLDHPGVGKSEDIQKQHIENIANAVVTILDAHDVQKAHIIGHSTGTLVAQSLALDHPNRVLSITLSGGWAQADKRFKDLFLLRKRVLQQIGGDEYKLLGQLLAYPSHIYDDMTFSKSTVANKQVIEDRIDMLLSWSRKEDLSDISLPALIIGAKDDWIVPYHHSQELARLIPGAKLHELSGGHFMPNTETSDYVERLHDFWEATA